VTACSSCSHGLVDKASYDIRIEAINFTLNHDDGASTRHYRDSEVILINTTSVSIEEMIAAHLLQERRLKRRLF
jgi:regulator of PEP synthase PpsR (kinase-PPPase family)